MPTWKLSVCISPKTQLILRTEAEILERSGQALGRMQKSIKFQNWEDYSPTVSNSPTPYLQKTLFVEDLCSGCFSMVTPRGGMVIPGPQWELVEMSVCFSKHFAAKRRSKMISKHKGLVRMARYRLGKPLRR